MITREVEDFTLTDEGSCAIYEKLNKLLPYQCYSEFELIFKKISNIKKTINKSDLTDFLSNEMERLLEVKSTSRYDELDKLNIDLRFFKTLYDEIEKMSNDEIGEIQSEFDLYLEKKNQQENNFKSLRLEIFTLLLQRKKNEATELIVQEFYKNYTIKVSRNDKNPEFMIYKSGIYIEEGRTYIEEFTRKILEQNYSTNILYDVINKISADNKANFEKIREESDPYLLATENCLINLRTNTKQKFSKDIILFNKLPVKYNPDAKCPNILKFLNDIVETKEDVKLLIQIIGFALVNDYFLEKAFMLVGKGRNGKGKFLSLLKNFFGLDNICSVRLQEMNTQSSSLCDMNNKYVNIAGDLSPTALKDTGLFKELTGRDPIQVKRKYKNDLKFINSATNIFACNDLPRVYDSSTGFWERWILINFPYHFIDKEDYDKLEVKGNNKIKNPDIIEDILTTEELSGLLNLALESLQVLKKHKKFTYSKSADEVRNVWVRKSDSFMAYCMDNLVEDYEGRIAKQELRFRYLKYCKNHKIATLSDKSIKITLEQIFGVIEYFNGHERFWEGINFKVDSDKRFTSNSKYNAI